MPACSNRACRVTSGVAAFAARAPASRPPAADRPTSTVSTGMVRPTWRAVRANLGGFPIDSSRPDPGGRGTAPRPGLVARQGRGAHQAPRRQHERLVRSSSDLADLIHRGVLEAAGTLVRTGQLLWDVHRKDSKEIWRPKSEVAFGAWLAEQLRAVAYPGRGRHQPRGARPGNDHPARPGGRHPGRRPGHRRPAGRAGPLPHRAQGKLAPGPDDRDAHPVGCQ